MITKFECPFLNGQVDFSEDRERHVMERHPDLLPGQRQCIIETLADPDEVRRSKRFGNALLISRWFPNLRGGKHVVVVVISEDGEIERNWIVTAYITKKLAIGGIEWKKN